MDTKLKKLNEDANKLKKEKTKKLDEIQHWIDKLDALQSMVSNLMIFCNINFSYQS